MDVKEGDDSRRASKTIGKVIRRPARVHLHDQNNKHKLLETIAKERRSSRRRASSFRGAPGFPGHPERWGVGGHSGPPIFLIGGARGDADYVIRPISRRKL